MLTLKELQETAGRHGHVLGLEELPYFNAMLRRGRTFLHVSIIAERWAMQIARERYYEDKR